MPLQVTAAEYSENGQDTGNIQLTDYRYENAINLLDEYILFNYYDSSKKTTDKDLILPSTVLKPDGTEMFRTGQYYLTYVNPVDPYDLGFFFPQNEKGDKYIINDIDTGLAGIIDNNGRIITDLNYSFIRPLSDRYYLGVKNTESNDMLEYYVINTDLNKTILNFTASDVVWRSGVYYISEDEEYILRHNYYPVESNGEVTWYIDYNFLDSDGKELESGTGMPEEEFFLKYFSENKLQPEYAHDSKGTKYYPSYYPSTVNEHLKSAQFSDITSDTADKTYIFFKTKDIGGKTYYAVFKKLQENEKEADFRPHETPSPWAKEGVDKLTEEGLLFNEANCRYTDNISRKDFAFLAVRAFCKAQGMDVDEYIKANNITLDYNKFTDTEDSYILLANYLGIVNGTSETAFSPAKGITRQEAAVMLDNTAGLLGLSPNSEKVNFSDSSYFANWAADAIYSISSIRTPDGTAIMGGTEPEKFSPWMTYTREQAYTTICRLYETAKKK